MILQLIANSWDECAIKIQILIEGRNDIRLVDGQISCIASQLEGRALKNQCLAG
jgi:hypothetical protein